MGTGTDGLDSCAPMRWYGTAKEETLVQQCNALEARRIFRRPSPWAVTVDPNGAEVDGKAVAVSLEPGPSVSKSQHDGAKDHCQSGP